jgi:DNA recombination protein RmuC
LNADTPLILAFAVVLTALVAWLTTDFILRRRVHTLEQENMRLQGEVDMRAGVSQENEERRKHVAEQFSHLSGEALERNNQRFLQLAEQHLKQYQEGAKADLSKREQAIEAHRHLTTDPEEVRE